MPILPNFRRWLVEDFDEKDQGFVRRAGQSLNEFADHVHNILNSNIDFHNLAQEIRSIIVKTDNTGGLLLSTRVATERRAMGVSVIRAQKIPYNSKGSISPFIVWDNVSNGIIINEIGGLEPDSSYRLTLLVYWEQ